VQRFEKFEFSVPERFENLPVPPATGPHEPAAAVFLYRKSEQEPVSVISLVYGRPQSRTRGPQGMQQAMMNYTAGFCRPLGVNPEEGSLGDDVQWGGIQFMRMDAVGVKADKQRCGIVCFGADHDNKHLLICYVDLTGTDEQAMAEILSHLATFREVPE
jgi:hypothetical protein